MITHAEKAEIKAKFGKSENDSGSPEVQVAILTKRINNLMDHFGKHIHGHHSKRGLLKMIGSRKAHLKYLAKKDHTRYTNLIKELGLRK